MGISGFGCYCLCLLHVVPPPNIILIFGTEPWPPNRYFCPFSAFVDTVMTFVNLFEGLALQAG